jgi:hypothetical protein
MNDLSAHELGVASGRGERNRHRPGDQQRCGDREDGTPGGSLGSKHGQAPVRRERKQPEACVGEERSGRNRQQDYRYAR